MNYKIKGKKGAVPIIMILALALVVGVIAFNAGVLDVGSALSSTGSGSYIERPVFKYIKCEAVSDLKYSSPLDVSQDGQWLSKPSITNNYNVNVNIPSASPLGYTTPTIEYYVCNSRVLDSSNCRVTASKNSVNYKSVFAINNVKPNEYVWIQYQEKLVSLSYKGRPGATYQIGYIPYGLREYNILSGRSGSIIPNDCKITDSSQVNDRFLSSDINTVNSAASQGKIDRSAETQLDAEEVRWYVTGYLTSAEPSFKLKYKNQDAWCKNDGGSASIWKINTVQLASGTYKIASVDWNDKLGTEVCCPGDKQPGRACNENFAWVSTQPIDDKGTTAISCSTFNPCDGGSYTPLSKGVIARYECVNSQCVQKTKEVQCSSDTDCQDANQICDRNSWSCVDANVNLNGQKIDTIPDNQQDCEAKSGKWITQQESQKSGNLCLFGVGLCETKVIVKEYCDLGGKFNLGKLILWIGIIVLAFIIIKFAFPTLRPMLKTIPVIGRIIP